MAAMTRFRPEARNCCASAPRSAILPCLKVQMTCAREWRCALLLSPAWQRRRNSGLSSQSSMNSVRSVPQIGEGGGRPASFLNMTDGATMPAFSDERLIDAAGAVVADRPEQRPLLVVAVASRLEVVVDAPPYPSHGAFCRSRALDREHQAVSALAQAPLYASVRPHGG